jgi:hypothetical protein
MVSYDLKWSETVKGKLCSAKKLLNKVSTLVTWSSTDFVGINWCNWGVLLVAVTAFLCKFLAGDKALMQESSVQRGKVNRYAEPAIYIYITV